MASRAKVEEYPHAYLVKGTANISEARKALWLHMGKRKASRIKRMPARPMSTAELGDKKPKPAVALYFAIGPGAEPKYKP